MFKARARFIHRDIDVTGDFYFDESGKFIRFETNDRYYSGKNNSYVKCRFSEQSIAIQKKMGC